MMNNRGRDYGIRDWSRNYRMRNFWGRGIGRKIGGWL